MMHSILGRSVVFLWVLSAMNCAVAQNPAPVSEIRDVEAMLYLIDIEEINSVSQSFIANFYVEYSWMDPGLAHDGTDSISRDLSQIWHPQVQFLNQQRLVKTFPETAEIRPDGTAIYKQRVWGSFSQPLELRKFPFDSQHLKLILVDAGFGSVDVRFQVAPESGVADNLIIPDWKIRDWSIEFGNEGLERGGLVLSLELERISSYFILKVILPLMLIVAMSYLVFWIDPSLAATQISVSVTAMLTLIAYRFAIGGMVPRLAFLTSLDYFVLGSTLLVFFSLVEVVYTARLSQVGELDKARAVDLVARWVAPLLYLLVVLEAFTFRFGF